jgi:hypothetical protein
MRSFDCKLEDRNSLNGLRVLDSTGSSQAVPPRFNRISSADATVRAARSRRRGRIVDFRPGGPIAMRLECDSGCDCEGGVA